MRHEYSHARRTAQMLATLKKQLDAKRMLDADQEIPILVNQQTAQLLQLVAASSLEFNR